MGLGEVKVYAFLGQPANSWDKNPYISGATVEAGISLADKDDNIDTIQLSICSGGGNVSDGNLIIAALQKATKYTKALIEGYAASMGYYSCLGAKEIRATRNSMIMTHGVQSSVSGSVQDMEAHIEVVKKFNTAMATLLEARTGLSNEEVVAKFLSGDTWFTAQEALDLHLIDAIEDYDAQVPELDVTAMSYTDFVMAIGANSAPKKETFADKIKASISAVLGVSKLIQPKAAVMLTDAEEYNLGDLIWYLRYCNDIADNLLEISGNEAVKTMAQSILTFSSKAIIDLTVLVYSEDAGPVEMDAKVKEIVAMVGARQTNKISQALAAEVEAKIAAGNGAMKAEVQILTQKLAEKEAENKALKAAAVAEPTGIKFKTGDDSSVDNPSLTEQGKEMQAINAFSFETATL